MIEWKKNLKGKIRGVKDDMIVYREETPERMYVFSETNLESSQIKFSFKITKRK